MHGEPALPALAHSSPSIIRFRYQRRRSPTVSCAERARHSGSEGPANQSSSRTSSFESRDESEEPPHRLGVGLPSLLERSLSTVTAEGAAEDMSAPPGLEDPAAVEALGGSGLCRHTHGWRMYRSPFHASELSLHEGIRRSFRLRRTRRDPPHTP